MVIAGGGLMAIMLLILTRIWLVAHPATQYTLLAPGSPALQVRDKVCAIIHPNSTRYTFAYFSCDNLVPPSAHTVQEVHLSKDNPGSSYTTSRWRIGAALSPDRKTSYHVIAETSYGRCRIDVKLHEISSRIAPTYDRYWYCTRFIGPLTITAVDIPWGMPADDLRGKIYFESDTGQTGHFNLETETWTIDP
jgi:hypothetical protein